MRGLFEGGAYSSKYGNQQFVRTKTFERVERISKEKSEKNSISQELEINLQSRRRIGQKIKLSRKSTICLFSSSQTYFKNVNLVWSELNAAATKKLTELVIVTML